MKKQNRKPRGSGQPRKDSRDPRVNFDNTRESKFVKDVDKMKDIKTSKDNDVKWYSKNPNLLEAAARIPFFNITGHNVIPMDNLTASQYSYGVPGVMSINYYPALGPVSNKALKQAMDSMHSYIVHANSRNESYDGPDVMMLVLAGIEVFSFIAQGIRVYGLMRQYDEQNYYMPQGLIRACGFDPEDLKKSYSTMWFDLNRLIAATKQIWVPNTMPLMERRFWMNSNIYKDAESTKAQCYLYKQRQFYKYNPTQTSVGGGLSPVYAAPNPMLTWAQYISYADTMLDALMSDADRGLIFGDILKAYGSAALYTIDELPIDYKTPIVYSPEVLTQIENTTYCTLGIGSFEQTADGNIIVVAEKGNAITDSNKGAPNFAVLNFHQKEQPTVDQIVVATRMTSVCTNWIMGTANNAQAIVGGTPMACGTEYAYNAQIYYATRKKSDLSYAVWIQGLQNYDNSVNPVSTQSQYLWSAFDWAPAIYISQINTTLDPSKPSQYAPGWAILEYDNYTTVDVETLERLHLAALYSEFGVPIDLQQSSYYRK